MARKVRLAGVQSRCWRASQVLHSIWVEEWQKRKYVGVLVSKPFVNLVKAVGMDVVLENHQNNQYHKDAVQRGLLLIQHQNIPEWSMPYLISQANRHVYQKNIIILKSIV